MDWWLYSHALKKARRKILASTREFNDIFNDIEAVLLCAKKENEIKDAFQRLANAKASIQQRQEIPSISDQPMGPYLGQMIRDLDGLIQGFE